MYRVLQPFIVGNKFFNPGVEIADDPDIEWAESRGLIAKIKDNNPEAKVAEKKKAPAKKTVTTTKKSTKK